MSTTTTSKSFSAKGKWIARPFEPGIIKGARALAARYTVVVKYEAEHQCFVGRAAELPHVIGAGRSDATALRETRALLTSALAVMIEGGQVPPAPGGDAPRTEQVNFRVSVEEKARMEAAAARQGLTLVDYVRGSALRQGADAAP